MADDKRTKLHVKIGEHEFRAEGPESVVQAQYQQFLTASGMLPPAGQAQPARPFVPDANSPTGQRKLVLLMRKDVTVTTDSRGFVYVGRPSPIDRKFLAQIFQPYDGGDLKLNALASTNAISLLLLLYGFRVMLGEDKVRGQKLLRAAQISGLSLDRVDRDLEHLSNCIASEGERRGKTYEITADGIKTAESLLKQWMGKR